MEKICGEDPIFIGCMPRSGSSLLRVVLDSHPQLSADVEINWVKGKRPFKKLQESYKKVVGNSDRRYVNKEPKIITQKGLRRLCVLPYDPINMIIIKRNSLDTLASYIKSRHYPLFNGMNMSAIFINDANEFARGYKSLITTPNRLKIFEIKYESIINEPRESIDGLCEFLGIEFAPSMLKHHLKKHKYTDHYSDAKAKQPIFKSSVNHHKKIFKEIGFRLSQKLENACKMLDKLLGYEQDDRTT